MKMTSSQLVTLVIAAMVCSAAVVYSQSTLPTVAPSAAPTDPPAVSTTQATPTQPTALPTTPRPPVSTPAPVDASTAVPPVAGSTAAPDMGVETNAPMASDDGHDGDNDSDEGDMDDRKGHDDKDGGKGGLRNGDIALAVLATLLICATIGTFLGLCYWKYKGTSYVTVTADTTYRQ